MFWKIIKYFGKGLYNHVLNEKASEKGREKML